MAEANTAMMINASSIPVVFVSTLTRRQDVAAFMEWLNLDLLNEVIYGGSLKLQFFFESKPVLFGPTIEARVVGLACFTMKNIIYHKSI